MCGLYRLRLRELFRQKVTTTTYVLTLAVYLFVGIFLQSIMDSSTREAEYMALTEAIKEVIWLQGLFDVLSVGEKYLKVK